MGRIVCTCVTVLILHLGDTSNIRITKINPREASVGGATRITIHGGNFAKSQFNHQNELLGNKVNLVSLLRSYPCEIHKDGTTEIQIVCITPPRMIEDKYHVKVSVDGEPVSKDNHCRYWGNSNCRVTVHKAYTPTITSLDPVSGPPDVVITVRGKLFSDRYGSHLESSNNEKAEKFLRAYMGGYKCELQPDPGDSKRFLLKLDSDGGDGFTDNGFYTCKIDSAHITSQNTSFIIEGKYGRSRPHLNLLRVSRMNKLYMFQSYAEITSVSPATGSVRGGTKLTIAGRNFDQTSATPANIRIAGVNCEVETLSANQITCISSAQPSSLAIHSGNRGIDLDTWGEESVSNIDDILMFNQTGTNYSMAHYDDLSYSTNIDGDHASRVRAFFSAPSNNLYRFFVSSDHDVSLYLSENGNPDNKVKIASKPGSTTASEIDLEAEDSVYLEVVHKGSGPSAVRVGVCVSKTKFTSGMTGASKSEKQKIAVRSSINKETQTITLKDFTPASGVSEVQHVDVTLSGAQTTDATFRLGIDKLFTEPIPFNAGMDRVRDALLAIPGVQAGTIMVDQSGSGNAIRYIVTFSDGLGDRELLTSKTHPGSQGGSLSVVVSQQTPGSPSLGYISLAMENVVTRPIPAEASDAEMKEAIFEMFTERCPRAVMHPTTSGFFEDFENSHMWGVMTLDKMKDGDYKLAFCGKSFRKNPPYLYKIPTPEDSGLLLSQHKVTCFAYMGEIQPHILLGFSYTDAENKRQTVRRWFGHSNLQPENRWRYVCVDVYKLANDFTMGGSMYYLTEVGVTRFSGFDLYVDTIFVGPKETTTDFVGLNEGWTKQNQALPSGHVINDVTVTKSSQSYTIQLTVNECGNDFKMFKLINAQKSSGFNTKSSQSVGYTYGAGSLDVDVIQEASPPVMGKFSLTYNGRSKQVNVKATAIQLQDVLHSMGVTGVTVARTDDCANFDWILTWLGKGGDQPLVEVSLSSLTGIDVSITASTLQEGMLCYDSLPGEFLRTVHDSPQVVGHVNFIPTKCDGSCSFDWSVSATPTVAAVTPDQGTLSQGTSITISGTRFSTTASENVVTIAGIACDVQSSTSTSVTCNVGNGPIGMYDVVVNVAGLGLVSHPSSPVQFTYVADVQTISPASGSIEGGTELSINGFGFALVASVTVGGNLCDVVLNTPALIKCMTPQSDSTAGGAVSVDVTQNGNALTVKTFTYDAAATPKITSITPTSSSVQGGAEIVVSGSGFGASAVSPDALKIGEVSATITSYSDTEVRGELPGQAPGSYKLHLTTGVQGYADTRTNSIPDLAYTLKVGNVFPRHGSLSGGTTVFITGSGFSTTKGDNMVKVGQHDCAIETATATTIVCIIADTGKLHQITNQGESTAYGSGYEWDETFLEVEVGDQVRWSWDSDEDLGMAYLVQRTADLEATEYDGSGFSSGTAGTSSGVYEYLFSSVGENYYWSGFVDGMAVALRGEVNVKARTSHVGYLSLTVSGYEAEYDTSSGMADPSPSGACPGDITPIVGCSDPKPTGSDASRFSFAFWECSSPVVQSMSLSQGTGADDIILAGTGFTNQGCQAEVFVGQYKSLVSSSSTDQIVFTVDPSLQVPIGTRFPVTMTVGNRGNVLFDIKKDTNRSLVVLPHVSEITPDTGSIEGGTVLTLTGGGFPAMLTDIEITVDGATCPVTSTSYQQALCTTGSHAAGTADLIVKVRLSNGQFLDAVCKDADGCLFVYSAGVTPVVNTLSTTSFDAPNTAIVISGSGFSSVTSDITVTFGPGSCSVVSASSDQITCNTLNVPAGNHPVRVHISGKGLALVQDAAKTITSELKIATITPSSGSIHGGTRLTLTGNGFVYGVTTVTMPGGIRCEIETVTIGNILCIMPAHVAGAVQITATSNSLSHSATQSFSYESANMPQISGVSPSSGNSGDTITITGSGFGGSPVVTIDGAACTVATTSPSLTCALGLHSAGEYPVIVYIDGKGNSNNNFLFNYLISLTSIAPTMGSFGGGQQLVLSGTGFDPSTSAVTVCGESCVLDASFTQTSTSIACVTPPQTDDSNPNKACDVVVQVNNVNDTLSNGYTYRTDATPAIESVAPPRGGTAGGTVVTITGRQFSSTPSENVVTIENITCSVSSATATQIVCTTGAITRTVLTQVKVDVANKGMALQENALFHYVDVWSSVWTWGGLPLPTTGDLVVIPAGKTILVDVSTPVLKMLLIQGGTVIFDEVDLEFQAENILITDGGALRVGTEAEPFQHKAIITLHGHMRSKELPIYGTKSLAVREGELDLHGKPLKFTWSRLAATANAGSSSITLVDAVDWSVGDQIVIATTNHRHSQSETEVRNITVISGDKFTLTLDSALIYKHLGVTETLGGELFEFRAEVGLLTRNVMVRGSSDVAWHDEIPACPEGFDTGEFATQTCFQGRFGDEMGSDEFGGQIMLHAPQPDQGLVTGRIEYVEVTHAGQAFRLGRYPIHFHINGNMSTSYVRGLAIHHTFNRAVNIHATHNVLVEHNVAYNIMGGAFFLEDGVETGNILQYNLALFVKSSTSLLNDDITPAAFWITNPNNIVQHNHAAGGTHFGFWYRMHDHPDGPSFDENICPKKVPLGVFNNNTVHSVGWFGLWIFQHYFPMEGGGCGSTTPKAAVFQHLIAWNCEKGAEWVDGGSIQFRDFKMINNEVAGIEGKKILNHEEFSDNGPMVDNSLIVAWADTLTSSMGATRSGIILPYGQGLMVKNTKVVNFSKTGSAALRFTRIDGTCSHFCGGFTYHFSGITSDNSPNMGSFEWTHEGILKDLDGSLTGGGAAERQILPTVNTLPASKCSAVAEYSMDIPVSVCDSDVHFIRFAYNAITPVSLEYKTAVFTNSHGNDSVGWQKKRITHKKGWMTTLVADEIYNMKFINGEVLDNISYTGRFDLQAKEDFVMLSQRLQYLPDRFSIKKNVFINQSDTDPLTYSNNAHGDWLFDANDNQLQYLVSGKTDVNRTVYYKPVDLDAYRCYYDDCLPPPDPNSLPPATSRPDPFIYWSDPESWKNASTGWGGNYGNGSYGLPSDGDDVMIPADVWMVADVPFPRMNKLYIYGTLELESAFNATMGSYPNFVLSATYIYIVGGRLIVGWEDNVFKGDVSIILRGSHATPRLDVIGGPELGSKAIGVFGGLDLHGKDVGVQWTTLFETAPDGASTITLSETVSWTAGDNIVLTPTGYDPWETETFRITSVQTNAANQMVLGLNASLQYRHVVFSESVNGESYQLTAEVGLLTRNIKVIGEDYSGLFQESFGARILVGFAANGTTPYLGYARISNTEFYHTGQEGYRDSYDPRHSVSYLDCGTVDYRRPSYVKKSAFHHGFATAVGVYGTNNMEISDNVIHHTVSSGIEVMGDQVKVHRNLVILMIFPGTYMGRSEPGNIDFAGAIDCRTATNLDLKDNSVSGSERIGFRVPGEPCGEPGIWSGNSAHSSPIGVGMLPDDGIPGCFKVSQFKVFSCPDFGVYVNTGSRVIFTDLILVNNMAAVFSMVIGPSATGHVTSDKFVRVENSLIVGTSDSFSCVNDVIPQDANFASSAGLSRSNILRNGGGKVGVVWPSFTQGSNGVPEKPFMGIMSYNTINGVMYLTNLTFAHFANKCGRKDVAIATNPSNDDGQHPIESRGAVLEDVANKVFIHEPNIGKVNPADCVDMDCDGLKKSMLKDLDGSFLGGVGTVIPKSEFEWDGHRQRGLGDYRIPKVMLTSPSGTRLDVNSVAPNKGIYRDGSCVYITAWQAYKCHNQNYEMLIIESMDEDTETRRLSPVAILVDKYVDLVNGPQDHGWCSGYTCQKRLSTFMALVPSEKEVGIYFTSTSPQSLRLHLLNSADNVAVVVSIWYSEPYRLDVYSQDGFRLPNNGYYDGNGDYRLGNQTVAQAKPTLAQSTGSNMMDRDNGLLYITVKGPSPILIQTTPVVVVAFQFLTVDQFFGDDLVNNLVDFLGVPADKVRIMNVVREEPTAPSGRRKRDVSSPTVTYYVEIGNQPSVQFNGTVNGQISPSDLTNLTTTLVNAALLGTLNINATIYIIEPLPAPGTPGWAGRAVSVETGSPALVQLERADRLNLRSPPQPLYEGKPFRVQPQIGALSFLGSAIKYVGTTTAPWEVTVTMKSTGASYLGAQLTGNTSATFINGSADFSGLTISHAGSYILEFQVTSPAEATNLTIEQVVTVNRRPLKLRFVSSAVVTMENSAVQFVLDLRDDQTDEKISDLSWRGHTWQVLASLPKPKMYWGEMTGPSNTTFNLATGEVSFPGLRFTALGTYHVRFLVRSDPPEYEFHAMAKLNVRAPGQENIPRDRNRTVEIKLDEDYDSVISSKEDEDYLGSYVTNYFRQKHRDVLIEDPTVRRGSIIVSFIISGNSTNVDIVVDSACEEIDAQTSFEYNGYNISMSTYFNVDGQSYYGSQCGTIPPSVYDNGLSPGVIAAIVIVILIFVGLVIAFLVWKFSVLPKTKTNDDFDDRFGSSNLNVEGVLFRENTFDSLHEKNLFPPSPIPPSDTSFASATSVRPFTALPHEEKIAYR